jgi:hypothetical protein
MMRNLALLFGIALLAAPVSAQERRYDDRNQGVPPGFLPRAGECRVWYDGRPPGQQPPPTNCRDAERIAARDRYTRVIYGSDDAWRDDGRWNRDDDRRDWPRAIPRYDPRDYQYPDRYPNGDQYPYSGRFPDGIAGYDRVAFENGYNDGLEKGRDDGRRDRRFDPARQGRYRSGDHGYDRRYGSKDRYKDVYRDGFQAGYNDGYRNVTGYRDWRGGRVR